MSDSQPSELQAQIKAATTIAMKARDKERVATLRMVNAELKRVEVDERKVLTDADVLAILTRMQKQRQDSFKQFTDAGREELAATEAAEMALIAEFMPQPLSADEINELIAEAIATTGAASMKDMGKVMGLLKPKLTGRADMGQVSKAIKDQLSAG